MALTYSQVLALVLSIKNETHDAANTAQRVGGAIEQLLIGATFPYDSTAAYAIGQQMTYSGRIWIATANTAPGENPANTPTYPTSGHRWRSDIAASDFQSATGSGANPGKTTNQIWAAGGLKLNAPDGDPNGQYILILNQDGGVVSKVPNTATAQASETANGSTRLSTDENLFTVDRPNDVVTARQFAQFRSQVLGARLIATYFFQPGTTNMTIRVYTGATVPKFKLENTGSAETAWLEATADPNAPGYYYHTYPGVLYPGIFSFKQKDDIGAGISMTIIPDGAELGNLARVIKYYSGYIV